MANRYSFETNVQDVLDDNSVVTSMIVDGNVTAGKLATDSVTTIKIVDANVTAAKLATDSVTTAKIVDSNVTTAKIADANVTAIKLAADSVTTVKILDANVTTPKLADGAVTPVKADLTAIWAFTTSPTVPTPTTALQVANKSYVDSVAQGLDVKSSVRVSSSTDVNVASAPATIDGVTMASLERVLLRGQSSAIENGIWVYNGAGNALTRAADMAAGSSAAGAFTFVEEGTSADTGWICTTDRPNDIVGTNSLTFTQFSGATSYTFRDGLTQSGANVDVNPGAGLVITGGPASGGSVKIGFAGEGWGDITFRGTSVWERLAPSANGLLQSNGAGANPSWISSISDTQHGNRGGGSLHSVATTSVAGFMSATDKTNLDQLMAEVNLVSTGSTTGAVTANIGTFTTATDQGYTYESTIRGRNTSTGVTVSFKVIGSFKNVAGTVTQIGNTTILFSRKDTGMNAADVNLVISGTNIVSQVTGVAAMTIDWRARVVVV